MPGEMPGKMPTEGERRTMHPMTKSHLQSAFAGESQAQMRYRIYADKADRDGFPNVARLFRAITFAEQVHATSHFQVMRNEVGAALTVANAGFGWGATAQNLAIAIEGEEFEVDEMYPVYKVAAELQNEPGAVRSFTWAWEAEKTHAALYRQAKTAVEGGQDLQAGTIHVCAQCGHTLVGEAPDNCPICNAAKARYRAFA
jgi:rubrerythrin